MYTDRRIIISPMVYLLEIKRQQWKGESSQRADSDERIVNGWILNTLPQDLREMAEEKHDQLVRLDIVTMLKEAMSEICLCFPWNHHND